jgi:succinyl-CoA synthetase beta subunit
VKLAGSADEAERVATSILGMDIKGMTVRKVLVGPAADIVKEFYLAAVLDRRERGILLMGSAEGGVEIEQVAATNPEAIVRGHADPARPARLPGARARVPRWSRRTPQGRRGDRQGASSAR